MPDVDVDINALALAARCQPKHSRTYKRCYAATYRLLERVAAAQHWAAPHIQDQLIANVMGDHDETLARWNPDRAKWTTFVVLVAKRAFGNLAPKHLEGPQSKGHRARVIEVLGTERGTVEEVAQATGMSESTVIEYLDLRFELERPKHYEPGIELFETPSLEELPKNQRRAVRRFAKQAKLTPVEYLTEAAQIYGPRSQ